MNSTKYQESNILIAQRKGLPSLVQQRIVISNEEIELAKQCILYLKQEIHKFISTRFAGNNSNNNNSNNNPIWIPYGQILAETLPAEKGTDTRTTKRIFSLLQVIPLAKANLRHKLLFGPETLVIAALEDLKEVLHITQNLSGMPAYKLKFFKQIFLPLYRSKLKPDKEEGGTDKEEKRIAVTSKQLCDYFKDKNGGKKTIATNNLKKTYLNELLNNGYIDEEDSVIDKRQKIYYPLIEFTEENKEEEQLEEAKEEKIRNYVTLDRVDNLLQHSKLLLPQNCRNIPENWLRFEILDLLKYPLRIDNFTMLDNDGQNKLCICGFEKEYEKNSRLSGYFSNPQNQEKLDKIFGDIKYLGKIDSILYDKLSTDDKVLQFPILKEEENQIPIPTLERDGKIIKPLVSVAEDFFHNYPNEKWQPLSEHSLEQSPCYPIIGQDSFQRTGLVYHYCKLHPEVWNINLEEIEHHCKYKEPDKHKAEMLKDNNKINS